MRMRTIAAILALVLCTVGLNNVGLNNVLSQNPSHEEIRNKSNQNFRDGNFNDAYQGLQQLCLAEDTDPRQVSSDLTTAVQCLQQLGRLNELDALLEGTIEVHKENWRLLQTAARLYNDIPHHGFIIAGTFERGDHRGGGHVVHAVERDRVRALQLLHDAMPLVADEPSIEERGQFYIALANTLQGNRGPYDAWRLQYLTDLSKLPDYEEGYPYFRDVSGAPVGEDGNPVYYHLPADWEQATNDGERWRWALNHAQEVDPKLENAARLQFGQFLLSQFGVQTIRDFGFHPWMEVSSDEKPEESGTYALHTLEDSETIARLATGVKRFTLPDEFNYIKVFQAIADDSETGYGEDALNILAETFENRRQYERAVEYWRSSIDRYGKADWKQQRIDQIVKNWCQFEPIMTQPSGSGATVEMRFRNGSHIAFEAFEIQLAKLLDDIKAHLKSNPREFDWNTVNVENIGWRLIQENQQKYIGKKVATWDLDVDPPEKHFDKRITVTTPLQKAGAYLVTANMADGNVSRIVLWVADTAIMHKTMNGQNYYFVADAVTGEPIAGANLEFFGYKVDQNDAGRLRVTTNNFAEKSDADGQVFLKKDSLNPEFQWLTIARTGKRLAYLGYHGVWISDYYDAEYNEVKAFGITDRPVYRPGQTMHFKFWVRHAKYDMDERTEFASTPLLVELYDPRGEKVLEQTLTTDEFGGAEGTYEIPEQATLGQYRFNTPYSTMTTFMIEEYKKPEYEVTIDAPTEPVMLGEQVKATITVKYYFGEPVVNATVKYKVMRSSFADEWYPIMPWDWCYGPGYWWFGYDYPWYPGWKRWVGCIRPVGWWWPRFQPPPEVVAEQEVPIGTDGTVSIDIDTSVAKALHADQDHEYTITAEVRDQSRRTIVGQGKVLVARKPFKVYSWVDRGYYRTGQTVNANFLAQTLDRKPVAGTAEISLLKITYDEKRQPIETPVQNWTEQTNDEGMVHLKFEAAAPGQYRLSCNVNDNGGHTIEGGYIFTIVGRGFTGNDFRYNELELIPDKREYQPGDTVKLQINTDRPESTVLLFLRPSNGVYLPPQVLRLKGKSTIVDVAVVKRDMPNFFVEAVTMSDAQVHSQLKEIVVPPEKRVLNVEVVTDQKEYKPGTKSHVTVRVTDFTGEAYTGTLVATMYDKAVEYISGGSNITDIREYFWKWRRHHHPQEQHSLSRSEYQAIKPGELVMQAIGVFGDTVADEVTGTDRLQKSMSSVRTRGAMGLGGGGGPGGAPMALASAMEMANAAPQMNQPGFAQEGQAKSEVSQTGGQPLVEATVRTNFADTALWKGTLNTNDEGLAELDVDMPENLTTWKLRVWGLGQGTRVGSGDAEVITRKNLMLRMQTPRFAIQKDEVILSANVHNYLQTAKQVAVSLELDGDVLVPMGEMTSTVMVPADGETRVDWRVQVAQEGEAIVRMKALTDEESDAAQLSFPCHVHGLLKTESWAGTVRPDRQSSTVSLRVPEERRPEQSVLEVRYSPTLAGAMVDALPYLLEYPYGCTEQTLNRFLPAAITQKVLLEMNLNLEAIQEKRTNLNAQEIGDDTQRAKQWKRYDREPVFSTDEMQRIVKDGVTRLTNMQNADGGWGWFSGYSEHSYPHTTAIVVRGLIIAQHNDVAVVPGTIERGIAWLQQYQAEQIQKIQNADGMKDPWKLHADDMDAYVYHVLAEAGSFNDEMRNFLYRDRNHVSVYGKALFALALQAQNQADMLSMVRRNIEQFLVQDEENETAYLRLPNEGYWWFWYGDEIETHAAYLKLLTRVDPQNPAASRLVKYLLNNRKHATYWRSTRDTAFCVEAFADFLRASGESKPDMTIEIWLDGEMQKEVAVTSENLFSFDNKFVLTGEQVTSGEHKLEVRRQGEGSVYFNAYLTNFTLEDPITKAGLEIKVERKFYKLTVDPDAKTKVSGERGQALDQRVEKYIRTPIENLNSVTSGDMVEVELEIDSKNDYEYIMFEDHKAAGMEPVEVRSGYSANGLGAYMELRDDRVTFFVRQLARGNHSIAYRLRAEIPGQFSALPAQGSGMYAPELKANSDEIKVIVEDRP